MHPDLERLLSEDEMARAGVDAAAAAAATRLDVVRADVARQHEERLRQLQRDLDATIAEIVARADRDVSARRAKREALTREHAAGAAGFVDRAVEAFVQIVRDGPSLKGPS